MSDFTTLPIFLLDGQPPRDTRSPYPTHAQRLRVGQPDIRDALSTLRLRPDAPPEPATAARPQAPAPPPERVPAGRVFTDEPSYASRIQARAEAPSVASVAAPAPPAARNDPPPALPRGPAALPTPPLRPEAMGLGTLIDDILATGLRLPPPVHRRGAGDLTEADTDDLFEVEDPDEVAGAAAAVRPRGTR